MAPSETRYAVWLGNRRIGSLHQRGDYTWFEIAEDYALDPQRPVLGLQFEQDLTARHAAALRLPPWFSNLLPEGVLRKWIADERGVSADREMELLAQVGHDLPGAVSILPEGHAAPEQSWDPSEHVAGAGLVEEIPDWRFSLAGVALKFSMLSEDDRLTLPAFGKLGDTIVKLPDRTYQEVPRNEYVMMSFASAVGIDVPGVKLVHRDELSVLPAAVWPGGEEWAYSIKRFDRDFQRRPIHIEDLAQVRNVYPEGKYTGNFETIASLIYRGQDTEALREFARRLAFMVLIANGDAHLKNWSLIYRDPRIPTLSPAYDLVATAWYRMDGNPENLGLKFGNSRRFEDVNLGKFARLQRKLGANDAELADVVTDLVKKVVLEWPKFADELAPVPRIRDGLAENVQVRSKSLLRSEE
ncbi:HipA domain-containing protein [Actinoallomurus sp. NPDC052308]|uniref:type II toxin-antitoxin system HipA family toxin n=1 Tax=Actinoallomurus sp. NPDC052308 TaxID=3155530 RepID=UPI00342411D6